MFYFTDVKIFATIDALPLTNLSFHPIDHEAKVASVCTCFCMFFLYG